MDQGASRRTLPIPPHSWLCPEKRRRMKRGSDTPASPFSKPLYLPASNRPMLTRAKSYSLLRGVS